MSVDTACRLLRLPTVRAQFPDVADRAAREQMSYRGFLAELLMAECDDRARRRSERRIRYAGFPRQKSLREFDFDANTNIDPAVISTLAKCDWIRKGMPLCLIGARAAALPSVHEITVRSCLGRSDEVGVGAAGSVLCPTTSDDSPCDCRHVPTMEPGRYPSRLTY